MRSSIARFRKSLARRWVEDECYDRVHLGPWTEPSVGVLLRALASSKAGAKALWLADIGQLSHDGATLLSVAVASDKVSRLTLAVKHVPDDRVAHLCEVLKRNRSIERLRIELENGDSAKDILRALAVNAA
ncbi:hypothetical protein HPB50_022589 [Hyalomma asiaticum]|uniref:Uncharacterized protein n=1 Tax=Hyalomma asiaticum TaxID=266040 RepID=A0ACB7SBT9_HYAAI|nr:hypothetical protein HPB50_022589 [Hyalomma asiaticum]